jgi:prepilin-type N-terminal cleavage/methylation domain-containing protein
MSVKAMKNGYTLVELLTVIVISGVAASIGMPLLTKSYPQRAVRLAGDQFVSTHALAKATAIRYGRLAELRIDATGRRFWVEVDTSSTSVVKKDTIGPIRSIPDATLIMTSDRSVLCFDARGMPSLRTGCQAANAVVTFAMGSSARTVRTTALGKVLR